MTQRRMSFRAPLGAHRLARIEIAAARAWGRAWLIGVACGAVIGAALVLTLKRMT
jgi:hypothetical protein